MSLLGFWHPKKKTLRICNAEVWSNDVAERVLWDSTGTADSFRVTLMIRQNKITPGISCPNCGNYN
jgi:hypothetical protein